MLREVFRIPWLNLPIYGYGLMLVVAFLACSHMARYWARQRGLDGELFINMALLALVTGVIGARLSDVLENWSAFTNPERSVLDNILDAINIRAGGLTFYGGFILAIPCCIFYIVKHKLPLLKTMDIVAPVVMIGLGFGRIGCYLNGCCYGEICRPPFGASLTQFPYLSNPYVDQFNRSLLHPPDALIEHNPDGSIELKDWDTIRREGLTSLAEAQKSLPVQPTQLYSSITAFLLMGLLWAYWTMPHLDGRVFALMMLLEGPSRFILEMIRVEPPVVSGHLGPIDISMSLSMVLGLLVFVAGAVMWVLVGCGKPVKNRGILAAPIEKHSVFP